MRIEEQASILLINETADGYDNHRIALHGEQLLIVGENEFQIQ